MLRALEKHMRVDVVAIPFCGGQDLRQVALENRRGILKSLVDGTESDVIRFSDEFDAPGHDITLSAGKLGLEGVVGEPDRMTFDLDPGEGLSWATIQEATKLVRVLLEELELRSFVKTSGGKGLHVVVPIGKQLGWDTVKDFSQAIVQHLASTLLQLFVAKSGPRNRVGKIFVDYLRNGFGATTACAWTRAAYRTKRRVGAMPMEIWPDASAPARSAGSSGRRRAR